MEINVLTFLIVCPLCFLAGILNASAGSGGLLSLPAFMIAGLPPHLAIGTNKLQAVMGMCAANVRFIRGGYLDFKLAAPAICVAIFGSLVGSNLSLICDESILSYLILAILPLAAFFVLNKKTFTNQSRVTEQSDASDANLARKTYLIVCVSAAIIGCYDGFYGPGTGTFLIIAFTAFAHLEVRRASAQAKAINFTTNLTAFIVFAASGNVIIPLGIAAGVCNILGSWIGAGLVIDFGAKIMRPALVVALVLLLLKALGLY
ncbi:TSUP family transporter [Eggerthellaceae bacterium 3-80]|nr:sulfite exporter TauE/SafE family protein [bacterium D16-34]